MRRMTRHVLSETAKGVVGMREDMINFNDKKTKKIVSSVIIILLVLAMLIPSLLYFL